MQDANKSSRATQWLHPLKAIASFWQDLPLGIKGIGLIALPLAVLLFSLSSLYVREQEATKLENKLRLALESQRDIQKVHSQLLEASTGVRDYLLTGDKNFLTIFFHAEKVLPGLLAQLQQQLENDAQKERLSAIYPLVMQNLHVLKMLSENESEIASKDLINQFKSQVVSLNTLRKEIERLNAEEAVLVAHDQQEVFAQRQRNINMTMIAAVAGILGSLIGVWLFSSTIVKRVRLLRDSAAHLAKAEALDLPSSSRDELGQLSNELDHASQLLAKTINEALQARHEAEEASAAKSMFLSRTSHELRTPLNAILGFAQILEEDLSQGKQRDSVVLIKGAGQHLLKLINEVLEVARIESGEMSLVLEPVNIPLLLDEAKHYIAPIGKIRDIAIISDYEADIWAMANRQKLLQIVLNLISNALKYGPDSATVKLRSFQRDNMVTIQVEDEGAGIASQLRDRLFTPFDRLGAEQTKIEGSGLGLAVSKQLIEAMHGKIDVAEGKGLFWVEIPCATVKTESIHTQQFKIDKKSTLITEKKTILYVEDNSSNRQLVQAIIQRQANLKLDFAGSIQEAKNYLSHISPALLLIDLHLPDGLGETLVQAVKANPQLRHIPIMILSADALPETIARLNSYGIAQYLTKPLDVAVFNKHLKALLASD